MNRIVLIGNGFDLAHGLKTKYEHFIKWYWDQRLHNIVLEHNVVSADVLCSLKILPQSGCENWYLLSYNNSFFKDPFKNEWKLSGQEFIKELENRPDSFEITYSPFLKNICKSIETKKWVDIENEYYRLLTKYALEDKSENDVYALNNQLAEMRGLLIDYLNTINVQEIKANSQIRSKLYSPIKEDDIAIGSKRLFDDYIDWCMKQEQDYWKSKMIKYGDQFSYIDVENYKENLEKGYAEKYPRPFMMPDNIMLLSFNYTKTASLYETDNFKTNYIHGRLEHFESVIFGYGDELDEKYKELQNSGNNDCLYNIKSIKYLESDN